MHLVLPAISLLLAQADPAHRTESSWPADFYASFTGGGFHQPEAYDGWQAGGGVGANWYLRNPLVDDGSPLSMQAFLQRLDRLSFDVSAGNCRRRWLAVATSARRCGASFSISTITRW
jgi:hypothetical protein